MWGNGPPCLIVPALISNVEIHWEHELYRRSLERMGRYMTCVWFDKCGIGLSEDSYIEFATGQSTHSTVTRKLASVLFTDIVDSTRGSDHAHLKFLRVARRVPAVVATRTRI